MKVVGITGGVGSGKSTVTRVFGLYGIPIYDSDTEAKKLMDTDPAIREKLSALLGDDIYRDGRLDRAVMSERIFGSDALRAQVESIVHPAVQAHSVAWQEQWQHSDVPYIMREAAIMIQSGSYRDMDDLIVVLAPTELRIQRLHDSRGYTREKSLSIMQAQLSDEDMESYADYKIFNNERQSLLLQVSEIHKSLISEA